MVKLVDALKMELEKHEIKLLDIYRYNASRSRKEHDVLRVSYGGKVFLIDLGAVKESLSLTEVVKKVVETVGARK